MSGLFITGTGTDVGKTVVAALLTLGLDGCYWKPVQAGTEPTTDTELVRSWTGLPAERFPPEAYRLRTPCSPHRAAALEGLEIDLATIVPPPHRRPWDKPLIVEGAGGALVPLNGKALMADLMLQLGFPVIVVASGALGTINHSLLTLEALQRRGLNVAGVIMSAGVQFENDEAVARYGGVPVLARIPPLAAWNPDAFRAAFQAAFNLPAIGALTAAMASQD